MLLCYVSYLINGLIVITTFYPNAKLLRADEIVYGNVIGRQIWYTTSDPPEAVAEWFGKSGWDGDLDDPPYMTEKNIRFGLFNLSRNIFMYQDSSGVIVINVHTAVYIPFPFSE
jgi:hypothetical protein